MIPPRLFTQTVTLETSARYDDDGVPIPGEVKNYRARVNTSSRITRNAGGIEVAAYASVFISGDVAIPLGGTLRLPGETRAREVLNTRKVIGAKNVEYTEVNVS